MATGAGLWLFVVILVVAIILSVKLKFNIGIAGFIGAFVLGMWVCGYTAKEVASYFPTNIVVTQFVICLFFGFAVSTGVFKTLGESVIYRMRHVPWAVPLVTALVGAFISILGAGVEATPLVMSPLAFAFALEAGFNPLVAAMSVYFGSVIGGMMPWTSGALFFSFAADALGTEAAGNAAQWGSNIVQFTIYAVMLLFVYFVTGAHKTKVSPSMTKPDPYTPHQKKMLAIVIVVIVMAIIPNLIETFASNPVTDWITTNLNIRVLCLFGTLVCIILKMADPKDVLMHKVPWGLLTMIAGMCSLVSIGGSMGVTDVAGEFIANSVPGFLVLPALAILGGVLSFFTQGTVIIPLILGLVPGLSAASGIDPLVLTAVISASVNPTGFSPISGGGAMATIGASDEVRERLFWPQMGTALFGMGVCCLFAAIGYFDFAVGLFA